MSVFDGMRVTYAGIDLTPDEINGYFDLDAQATLTVKPLGRGRRRTSEIRVSNARMLDLGDVIEVGGERLRVMAVRWEAGR
jgi:hypothetical protein